MFCQKWDLLRFINYYPLLLYSYSDARACLRFSSASVCFQPLESPSCRVNGGVVIMTQYRCHGSNERRATSMLSKRYSRRRDFVHVQNWTWTNQLARRNRRKQAGSTETSALSYCVGVFENLTCTELRLVYGIARSAYIDAFKRVFLRTMFVQKC